MENLLLVWDEIDDVFSSLRAMWPSIASFLTAVAAFTATGLLSFYAPVTVIGLAMTLLLAGLVLRLKDRELAQSPAQS
jgi:ABC-type transport system involved in cytochrome bd biosynthesis fused ATPase/permease subunit